MNSEQLWRAFRNCTDQEEAVAVLSLYSYTTVQSTKGYSNGTLLHWAADSGWTRVCQLLTDKYQIDPDCRNTWGKTPLYYACVNNKTDTVHYLVSHCYCDPLIKVNDGQTPYDYSSEEVRDYLEDIIDNAKSQGFDSVPKYIKHKNDKNLEESMSEGGGELLQSNIILHGPPGAGKTSLKQLMIGLPPLPKEKQFATNIIDNAVRAVSTDNVRQFSVIENDKMLDMLAEEVDSHVTMSKQGDHGPISTEYRAVRAPEGIMSKLFRIKPSFSNPSLDVISSRHDSTDPSKPSPPIQSIRERLGRATGPVKIYDSSWHHIVDSGGQPQFMDILPLVYQSPSLNIIVIRLTDDLDDKSKVCFYEEGSDVYTLPDRLLLTNREFIVRMCQTAASCSSSGGVVPYVMIIGTHLDKLGTFGEARVQQFNHQLADIRKEFNNVLICKSDNETIFPINTMAVGDDRQAYTTQLQECITAVTRQHVSPVKVPLRWLVYQLHLDKRGGVVRLSDCYSEGESLKMTKMDVQNALMFFSKLALILYFPNDIPDLVLTKMDPLISRLSKLVKASFIPPKHCPPAESDKLRTKGLFDKNYLLNVFSDIQTNDLSNDEFLKLLQCLKIAVQVKKNVFFLPSALSLEPYPEDVTFEMSTIPLVFEWGERLLPHGFFFTVANEVLGSKGDIRFELRTDISQWRGEIQVSEVTGKISGVVKLTNRIRWIQVSTTSFPKNCPVIYKAVKSAVNKTVKRFKTSGIGLPTVTIICPLCDTKDHYCVLSADKKELTCCINKGKNGLVSSDMMCWLQGGIKNTLLGLFRSNQDTNNVPLLSRGNNEQDKGTTLHSSSTIQTTGDHNSIVSLCVTPVDDRILQSNDNLATVLGSVIAITDWTSLGLTLGIPYHELERIRLDGYDERDRLRRMVSMWLDNGTGSWKYLVEALLHPLINRIDIANTISQQHPLDRPLQ